MAIRNKKLSRVSKMKSRLTGSSIDEDELFTRIQKRAYEIYGERGYSHGSDWNDWFQAEHDVQRTLRIR